jgi:hypothetical protein
MHSQSHSLSHILVAVSLMGALLLITPLNNQSGLAFQSTDLPEPIYDPDSGLWYMPDNPTIPESNSPFSPADTGGPDDYGYTWDDSIALSWVDAMIDGTDTGLSGSSFGKHTDLIPLLFPFKYYENTYDSLFIAASGYVAFTHSNSWPWQPKIPSLDEPNNIVAPYATVLSLASAGTANRIYYDEGGLPPNRYFVVEWYQVASLDNTFTYEVILHENGEIVFNYQTMLQTGPFYCGTAGIEDSTGEGLNYSGTCSLPSSGTAVSLVRPEPDYRVKITPPNRSGFTTATKPVKFPLTIINTGEMGNDTFNLASTSSWPVTYFEVDGTTLLTDTDGEGTPDTGILAQGASIDFTIQIQTPGSVVVGDDNCAVVTASSSYKIDKDDQTTLCLAIPASFAQVLIDNGVIKSNLIQSTYIQVNTYGGNWTNAPAIAETKDGFIIVWYEWRSVGSIGVCELHTLVTNHFGIPHSGANQLTDLSSEMYTACDEVPTVAVAPDGRIGITWLRYLINSTGQYNYNVYFAILDPSGNLLSGPRNITSNGVYGSTTDDFIPFYYKPSIASTGNNRFLLAWERQYMLSGEDVSDICFTIRNTDNIEIQSAMQFTMDTAGPDNDYSNAAVTGLNGNRFLLAYKSVSNIAYAVLESGGLLYKDVTDSGITGFQHDVTELSNGKIIIAASDYDNIVYVILDSDPYDINFGPADLNETDGFFTVGTLALASDQNGNASLVWYNLTYPIQHSYYSLIDGNGNILIPSIAFYTSPVSISSNQTGYSITTYNWIPTFYLPLIIH